MKLIHGGVTAPIGFKASGLYCGIKKSKKKDLALIYSEKPCLAAGVFTTNKIQASCVVINKEYLKDARAQAIVARRGQHLLTRPEEILKIKGIGRRIYRRCMAVLRVSGPTTLRQKWRVSP